MIYAVLAHHSPEALRRLLEKLGDVDSYFVVHIDKNQDIAPFIDAVKGIVNCHFTPERYASYWGSFALVEATLHVFDYIRKVIRKRHRIILLSGSDYPIKDRRYIAKYLDSHKDTIFIESKPIPRKIWSNGGINRFPMYDNIKGQLSFYCGSQWFSMPYKAISIIFSFLKENPDYLLYFEYVKIPDESFFQTLFMNCGHPYVKENLRDSNLHYIKWDKPYMHPRTMTLSDYAQLKKSKCLFARKFDPISSSALLYRLNGDYPQKRKPSLKRTAIIFLTDKSHDEIRNKYDKLKKEVQHADVFKIVTDKNYDEQTDDVLLYEHAYCRELGYLPFDEDQIIPGCTYFSLLYFSKFYPDYDDYWLIEDDVWYNGSWGDFFLRFKDNDTDFISTYFTSYMEAPHWYWWNSISKISAIPNDYKLRTFYPICRFSSVALQFLDKMLKKGHKGHGEVLVPTLLHLNGFSLYDIARSVNSAIIPCTHKAIRNDNNGSFRYRPLISPEEITGEFLFHPVKHDL